MTLQEVVKMVEALSPQEQVELREYLNQRPSYRQVLSPQERVERLDRAAQSIRAGFSDDEWLEIEADMNRERTEAHDEDVWRD